MKKQLPILALLLCFSSAVSAQVIWSADPSQSTNVNDFFRRFDSGNYPTDFCYTSGDQAGVTPSTVSTTNDPVHGKVWKVNKPKNRKRGEFARTEGDNNFYKPSEGDDIYIGWRWKIDTESGPNINTECTVWQWKSAGAHDQNYPLNMEYDGDLTLNAWGPDYANNSSQSSMRTVLWRRAVPQDTWVTLVVRIKVDRDDFGGIVQFWFNGEQQKLTNSNFDKYQVNLSADRYTARHRTNDGSEVYPKWGIYNKKSCSYNASAYFDEMKIGNSLSSVMPTGSGTPNQAPTVNITSPANGAVFTLGETIALGATASDSDGSIAKVNFKIDGSYYSQDVTGPNYTGTFTPAEAGTYTIGARAFDNEDLATEKTVVITVEAPNNPPSGYFVSPTFDEIEEGYSQLYVRVQDTDIDGDSVDITLYIDDDEIRTERGGPFEWGHVTATGADFTIETLNREVGEHVLRAVIEDEHGATATITKTITVTSTVTSLEALENKVLSIFPNPSTDGAFYLNKTVDFEVFNLSGHMVRKGISDRVNLQDQPRGVYTIKVQGIIYKIVK